MLFHRIPKWLLLATGILLSIAVISITHTAPQHHNWQQRIESYHADAPKNNASLKVVYFHPNDTAPYEDYQQRLTSIMKDVQQYYAREMSKYGLNGFQLPLEMEGNQLTIYRVEGKNNSKVYTQVA